MGAQTARYRAKSYSKKDFDTDRMYQKLMPSTLQAEQSKKTELPPLHNFMEDILWEKLPEVLNFLKGCDCERCRRNAVALALNQLPAVYLTTEGKQAEADLRLLRGEHDAQATAALIQAIRSVRSAPDSGHRAAIQAV